MFEIENKIKFILEENFGIDSQINIDDSFSQIGIDSLDIMDFIFIVEEEFNVVFSNDFNFNIDGRTTIREVVDFIGKNIKV
jgi:acyl carrier protein